MRQTPNLLQRLVSVRQQLASYADVWRSLPSELAWLAESCANSVDDNSEWA